MPKLKINDFVFAKLRGFAPWPAIIIEPPNAKLQKDRLSVFFYGTKQIATLKTKDIFPFFKNRKTLGKFRNNRKFNKAMVEINEARKKRRASAILESQQRKACHKLFGDCVVSIEKLNDQLDNRAVEDESTEDAAAMDLPMDHGAEVDEPTVDAAEINLPMEDERTEDAATMDLPMDHGAEVVEPTEDAAEINLQMDDGAVEDKRTEDGAEVNEPTEDAVKMDLPMDDGAAKLSVYDDDGSVLDETSEDGSDQDQTTKDGSDEDNTTEDGSDLHQPSDDSGELHVENVKDPTVQEKLPRRIKELEPPKCHYMQKVLKKLIGPMVKKTYTTKKVREDKKDDGDDDCVIEMEVKGREGFGELLAKHLGKPRIKKIE